VTAAACVAAPHPAAVDAAGAVWLAGGNAIDMALAAATALVVAYPHQCALGGDLVALARAPGGRVDAIVSIGAAPARIPVEQLRAGGPRMPTGGPHTVTVPGVLAGWETLAALGARHDLRDHLLAAAGLAADGVPVAPGLAAAIARWRAALAGDGGMRALLLPDGEPLAAGAALVQPRLAETLRAIAAGGSATFYGGEVGRRLAAGLRGAGATLDASDLAAHAAETRSPLTGEALGATWHAAPPPTQGATLLGLLTMLGERGPSLASVRSLAAARAALLGDPRRGRIDVEGLRTGVPATAAAGGARAAGDTIAVATADRDGNAVALIQSVYQTFGAGILEPDTGIVLQSRGSAFSLVRGHPGELAPGARPPHTLCPVIADTGRGTVVAAGCQGGSAQPQVLAQVAHALIDERADLDAAIAAPRWVVGARDVDRERETVLAEPGAHPPRDEAAAAGIPIERLAAPSDLAGHVQAARLEGATLAAGSDPRADGRALVLDGA
jgi:gamma-glutamyltranspeptidase